MRRFIAVLMVAMMMMIVLAAIGSPASAGPTPKVSERVKISSDCVATVIVSWNGADWASTDGVYGNVTISECGTGASGQTHFTGTSRSGRVTLKFNGVLMSQAVDSRVEANVTGVGYVVKTVNGLCGGWTVAP